MATLARSTKTPPQPCPHTLRKRFEILYGVHGYMYLTEMIQFAKASAALHGTFMSLKGIV